MVISMPVISINDNNHYLTFHHHNCIIVNSIIDKCYHEGIRFLFNSISKISCDNPSA